MWVIGVGNWCVVGTSYESLVYVTGVLLLHVIHWCVLLVCYFMCH